MITHFEHFLSFIADNQLQANMERWQRAGFILAPRYTKHEPGLENGFIHLTGTYLEFVSVADFEKFNKTTWEPNHRTRHTPRIIGAGAYTINPYWLHGLLRPKFPELQPCFAKGPADAPKSFTWAFCSMPMNANPGLFVFGIRPLINGVPPYDARIGANSIYGITGLILCQDKPEPRQARWSEIYKGVFKGFKKTGDGFGNAAQAVRWITPAKYQEIFNESWVGIEGAYYDTAALMLGASDPALAFGMLSKEGF
ncbi:hypothetical protein WDW86_04725 [Bdellovibrionota bacterium FG-2]